MALHSFPLYSLLFSVSLLSSLLSLVWTTEASLPKHYLLLPGKERSSAPTDRFNISQWTTRKGLGETSRISPLPFHIPLSECTASKATKQALSNTDVLKAKNENKEVTDNEMYSSAVSNVISCLPSLQRPLQKELFFQIQILQYLSTRPVCQSRPLKKSSQKLQLSYASSELKYTDVQNLKGILNEAMI